MAVNGLPWFKVQSRLCDSPKFRALSLSDRGILLSLWSLAAGHSSRGKLPDNLKVVAECLGFHYSNHPSRVVQLLDRFVSLGWLDKSGNSYSIHDWDHWQGSRVSSVERVRARVSCHDSAMILPNLPSNLPSVSLETKLLAGNNLQNEPYRGKREKKKEQNHGVLSLFPDLDGLSENSVGKTNGGDPRTIPLKAFITSEWLEWRGCSITSASTARDWDQFAAMLRRSRGDPAYSLAGLQSSFSRFAAARDRFTRSQGLGYWSLNAFRWFPDSVVGSGVKRASSERTARGNAAGLLSSDWWRDA